MLFGFGALLRRWINIIKVFMALLPGLWLDRTFGSHSASTFAMNISSYIRFQMPRWQVAM